MQTLRFLLYKEFRQIVRNRALLPLMLIMPIVQLLLLALAADFEVKNLKLYIVDQDGSAWSQRLTNQFEGSAYFILQDFGVDLMAAERAMDIGEADLILTIPANWERDLVRENRASVRLVANAIDGTKGLLGSSYAAQVIGSFNQQLIAEYGMRVQPVNASAQPSSGRIMVEFSNWYNPEMDYQTFMVPGILGLLVTMIGGFLSAINLVREKELGTIEQLNVTPLKKHHFLIGKLLPFWIIAMVDLGLGLIVGKLVYDIPIVGSVPLLFAFSGLYLLVVLGVGLLISTTSETQQQAMFVAWFFMVIFIFLSGLFTAIENMPTWAQQLTYLNPVRYFIEVVRLILLKGAGWAEIQTQTLIVAGYAVAINGLAVWSYRKRG